MSNEKSIIGDNVNRLSTILNRLSVSKAHICGASPDHSGEVTDHSISILRSTTKVIVVLFLTVPAG
jgi:hypothetical protein